MITHPGLPSPVMCDFLSREASRARYAPGVEFQIGKIEMVANTGTYVDAPFHRYAGTMDVAALPLERLAGLEALVVDGPDAGPIEAACFASHPVRGRAVLVRTGWDRHWGTPAYLSGHPFLTAGAAAHLARAGAVLVGVDTVNVDDLVDPARPVHSTLLGAGIPIVEHLTGLRQLPRDGFRFWAVPAKVAGMGSWPVRAYAEVGESA